METYWERFLNLAEEQRFMETYWERFLNLAEEQRFKVGEELLSLKDYTPRMLLEQYHHWLEAQGIIAGR